MAQSGLRGGAIADAAVREHRIVEDLSRRRRMSMWTENADWRDLIKKADAYKAVGHTTIYLHGECVYPWELVTKVEPGGGIRMGMSVGVRITAEHAETGLRFDWSVDIESREANGKGSFEIDTKVCRELMAKLP